MKTRIYDKHILRVHTIYVIIRCDVKYRKHNYHCKIIYLQAPLDFLNSVFLLLRNRNLKNSFLHLQIMFPIRNYIYPKHFISLTSNYYIISVVVLRIT